MKNHIQICIGFLSHINFVMNKGKDIEGRAFTEYSPVSNTKQAYGRCIFLCIASFIVASGHCLALIRMVL